MRKKKRLCSLFFLSISIESLSCSFNEHNLFLDVSGRITTYESMRQAICQYAERAAEKLRLERQYCGQVSAFIKPRLFQNMNPITAKSPANSSAFHHVIRGTLSRRRAGLWIKSGKTDITMQRRVSCSTISVPAELPSYRYLMKGGRMQTVTRS